MGIGNSIYPHSVMGITWNKACQVSGTVPRLATAQKIIAIIIVVVVVVEVVNHE